MTWKLYVTFSSDQQAGGHHPEHRDGKRHHPAAGPGHTVQCSLPRPGLDSQDGSVADISDLIKMIWRAKCYLTVKKLRHQWSMSKFIWLFFSVELLFRASSWQLPSDLGQVWRHAPYMGTLTRWGSALYNLVLVHILLGNNNTYSEQRWTMWTWLWNPTLLEGRLIVGAICPFWWWSIYFLIIIVNTSIYQWPLTGSWQWGDHLLWSGYDDYTEGGVAVCAGRKFLHSSA